MSMTHATWDEALEMGVPFIDDEHRELTETLSRAVDRFSHEVDERWAMELFSYLDSHLTAHIIEEERMMDASGYPIHDQMKHKHAHRRLREYIKSLKGDLEHAGHSGDLIDLGNRMLATWILRHTDTFDRAFVVWYTKNRH